MAHLKINELEPKLRTAEAEAERIHLELENTRAQLVCLENSRSWKITKPLRKFKAIFSKS